MDLNQFSTVDIVLDKANDNFIQKQTISAGDRDGRSLTLQVTDAGSIGEVPGLTANLLWTNHSSGLSDLSAFSVVDRLTSVFKIEYPQNMLTAGKVTAQIQLLHNGKVTHSKKFEIIVLDIAGKLKGVLQSAEYTALVEALAKANEFETEIAKKADKTQVDALGSEIGVARDGAQTLGERLDSEKTEVSAQLAQTETRLNNGDIFGVPVADLLKNKKIEIVAGAIRQDPVDRTKWNFINDSLHTPVGVSGAFATAVGSTITIPFAKTYSKVIAGIATPDESLANAHNLSIGASVGTSEMKLKAAGSIEGAFTVYWDGVSWSKANGAGQDLGGLDKVTLSYSAGVLTVTHGYARGVKLTVTPMLSSGSNPPFIPVIFGSVSNTGFKLKFLDVATNTFRTDASPVPGMSFLFTKSYAEGIHLDGTLGSDDLSLDLGNIWFFGLFEV